MDSSGLFKSDEFHPHLFAAEMKTRYPMSCYEEFSEEFRDSRGMTSGRFFGRDAKRSQYPQNPPFDFDT
ncbi:hypothetical protein FACS1894158_10070 [Betaproteobacteria bacterium]|nr:hypothetical protein FACS1894158_10070 [Betaproteobacteria bacterium]